MSTHARSAAQIEVLAGKQTFLPENLLGSHNKFDPSVNMTFPFDLVVFLRGSAKGWREDRGAAIPI